ncbi:MAG: autotransporter outer membrane beta-barrel domain-containing protein, partial [Verrucomicrobiota bacterium]
SAFSRKEIHPSAQMAALDTSLLYVETLRRRGGLLNSISGSSSDLSSRSLPDIESSPWHTTVPAGAHVGYEPEWSAWSAFMGSDTSVDGNDGIPGWNSTRYGFAFGFENRDPADFHFPGRVGFSAGYLTTDLATGASDAEIESWHLGFYATTQAGPLSLSGAAAFAHFDFEFDRFVSLGNGAVIANGDADGNSVSGSFEAFLDLAGNEREGFRFGPIATLGMVYGDRGGFSETGAGLLNLTVDADDGFQTISGLGLAMGVDRTLGGIPVTVEARALWEHVFGDTGVTTNSTIPFVGGAFSTSSAAIERNRASFGLGYALQLSEDVSAHIRYDGTFFDSVEDHRGSVGITVEF